jgi:hypothetical protein
MPKLAEYARTVLVDRRRGPDADDRFWIPVDIGRDLAATKCSRLLAQPDTSPGSALLERRCSGCFRAMTLPWLATESVVDDAETTVRLDEHHSDSRPCRARAGEEDTSASSERRTRSKRPPFALSDCPARPIGCALCQQRHQQRRSTHRYQVSDRVSERRRAVALARHYRDEENLTIAEIARRLGRAEATVKAYLYDPSYANKGPYTSLGATRAVYGAPGAESRPGLQQHRTRTHAAMGVAAPARRPIPSGARARAQVGGWGGSAPSAGVA